MEQVEAKLKQCIEIIEEALSSNRSVPEVLKKRGINNRDFLRNVARSKSRLLYRKYDKMYNKFIELYKQYVEFIKNSHHNNNDNDINFYAVRSCENNKILFYKLIYKNKERILSLDDVEKIYCLYTEFGNGLSKSNVAKYFTNISIEDITNIISILGLKKQSLPIAPHKLEESEINESVEDLITIKENAIREKYNNEKYKLLEKRYINSVKQNQLLLDLKDDMSTIVKEYSFKNDLEKYKTQPSDLAHSKARALVIHLSDMHVGASVSDESIYDNEYDMDIVISRMNKIIDMVRREAAIYGKFSCIVINNLGDSLDGFNEQTVRGGHMLPQNMTNKEQLKSFIGAVSYLVYSINDLGLCDSILYYAVGDSNHDGDFGYAANCALCAILNSRFENVHATVYSKFIDGYTIGTHSYILCHGKDSSDMKKGMPLVLDYKTENLINEYITSNKLNLQNKELQLNNASRIHFIKGDLHNSATTYGKQFRYKSVGSFFGSSKWVHSNFGNTKACVDYDIISLTNDYFLEGRLILN